VLEERGHRVRCLARDPRLLVRRSGPRTEVVAGDLLDPRTLGPACEGIDAAYYMVHSMGQRGSFERADREAAEAFGSAARAAGVGRIVYLGGLGDDAQTLSPHLRSRHEVGEILRASGIPVVELRASIVIGSGSLSFEMIRALVEHLPVMITPRWVAVPSQPIAITDLLEYLVASLEIPLAEGAIFEIGGRDVVSYGDLMREYARQRGLRRLMLPVPVLTPWLSSLWLGLVTPLYARVGRRLVDSIRHPTVVRDPSARSAFAIEPMGVAEAIASALRNEDREVALTRWSDALGATGAPRRTAGTLRVGRRFVDSRSVVVPVPPAAAFAPIRRIGGARGWYAWRALWRLRSMLDVLAGGVGMRRGRPHPEQLRVGDVLDWWRVEAYEPDRRLRLAAEMKLPGRAWLEFEVSPAADGAEIRQTAIFDPSGLAGLLYWYGVLPLHALVFRGMLAGIAAEAIRSRAGDGGKAA
jgi:uncharacterized protein YbjT (DUF2867 family)